MEIICPHCKENQKSKPVKSWMYGKIIEKHTSKGTKFGPSVECSRFLCKCGKPFNYYKSKNKDWTIPKIKK